LIYSVQGGKILFGGSAIESEGNFVQPTIVEISASAPVVKEELFGPVLYVMKFQVAYSPILCFCIRFICLICCHCEPLYLIIIIIRDTSRTDLEGSN